MSQPWPRHSESDSDPASLSPRTDLLSPLYDDVHFTDSPRRISRGPSTKFRHARERAHSTVSQRDLLQRLVSEEYESQQMRKLLYTAFDRLEHETKRAEAAETARDDTLQRVRAINEGRVVAQQQAARAQEELKLYKLQLDNAQKEILRAQDVLKAIEAQRDEAEAAAVSARSKARRLNEERLIEMAREEGRRLGFEEGVRRGRRIGHREAYAAGAEERHEELQEVASAVVNRLLEDREEPEPIEVQPMPVPPPSSSRSAPDVVRVESPINSSLEQLHHGSRSRHDSTETITVHVREQDGLVTHPPVDPRFLPPSITSVPTASSQGSRPTSAAWAGPPPEPLPFTRPTSRQGSPTGGRPSDIHIPPDNYIPTADSHHNISLPPPHELSRNIPSPTPSQRTLGPERRRSRDYIYDNYPPRRGSPDDSLASGKQSVTSTISQLDIVGLPVRARDRGRSEGLSVIHEDASMRSERMTDYSHTMASGSQADRSFREMRSNDTLRQDRESKQQLADQLRYSDPMEAEQWRRQYENSRSPSREGPPRQRPSHVTMPAPLSPPHMSQPEAYLRRSVSERQSRPETRSDYTNSTRDQRRPRSSDSSVPEINVEPPSNPPSDAPSRRGPIGTNGLLSPDHAHQPLPIPVSAPPPPRMSVAPNPPGPPVIPGRPTSPSHVGGRLPDGMLPPGFLPSPWEGDVGLPPVESGVPGSSRAASGDGNGGPAMQRYAVPQRTASERDRDRDREHERDGTRRARSPVSFYAASPVPAGLSYPAPPISRSATYSGGYTQSNPSLTSEGGGGGGRKRRDSLGPSASVGMAPASRARPVASTGSTTDSVGAGGRGVPKRQSSASLGSSRGGYARYDPTVYNDPAYLASSDELTEGNTMANGRRDGERERERERGRETPVRPIRVRERGGGSPGYMYAGLREH